MALSKAKSGSAWQSHFWQCGTLRPARNTKLLHYASKLKGGLFKQQASTQLGRTLFGVQKANVFTARKWDCCSDLLRKMAQLYQSNTFASITEWQDSGEHGCWLKVSSPPACRQSWPKHHVVWIVWVLLSQAFATWRGEVLIPLRQCWRMLFLCLRLRSFVLVSWCVVCFWAPPFAP